MGGGEKIQGGVFEEFGTELGANFNRKSRDVLWKFAIFVDQVEGDNLIRSCWRSDALPTKEPRKTLCFSNEQ